jgi:hypothetical protein
MPKKLQNATRTAARLTGIDKLSEGVAYALFRLTPEYRDLERMLQSGQVSPDEFVNLTTGDITPGQVVGSGVRTVATIASAGTLSGARAAVTGAAPGSRILGNVARGTRTGAAIGGAAGLATGAVQGIREGDGPLQIGTRAVGNALATGAAGALTGAGIAGLGGGAVGRGALAGLKTGAKAGGLFGGISGLATSIEKDKTVKDTTATIAGEAIRGAAIGGATGATLGGVTSGIVQWARNRAQDKKILMDALTRRAAEEQPSGIPFISRKAAAYNIDEVSKTAVKDKNFIAAVRDAALPPDDIAVIKASTPEDRKAFRQMLSIAESDNVTEIRKPIERVGQTVINRMQQLAKVMTTEGRNIDDTARKNLSGMQIPQLTQTVQSFDDTLISRGVSIGDDGKLIFDGSDFEDLPGIQRLFNTVYKRVHDLKDDGLKAHQLKRFIDTQVEYGKTAEGLTGSAERIFKGLRAQIDEVLDTASPAYNKANTRYATAINARDTIQRLLGKDFAIDDQLTKMRAGEVMARILGNASARPLQAINELEMAFRDLGIKSTDNIVVQVRFADLLEDITGAPTRSLAGQVERAGKRALSLPEFVQKSLPLAENVQEFVTKAMNQKPEQRMEALLKYLNTLD